MKMKVLTQKVMEVESSNPIFEKLLSLHRAGQVGSVEQYSEACMVIEGITGIPIFNSDNEFEESITGIYTDEDEEAILEA